MCISRFYLLLAALSVLLSVLGFSQQVGEGQRFEGARAGGSGIPKRVGVPRVPPTPDRAERPRPHAAWRVDAVDANHRGEFRVQRRSIWFVSNFTRVRLNFRVFVVKRSDPGRDLKTWKEERKPFNDQKWPKVLNNSQILLVEERTTFRWPPNNSKIFMKISQYFLLWAATKLDVYKKCLVQFSLHSICITWTWKQIHFDNLDFRFWSSFEGVSKTELWCFQQIETMKVITRGLDV